MFGLTFSAIALREYPTGRELAGIALVLAGLAGGLARPAPNPRDEKDKLRPGQAEDTRHHVADINDPQAPVNAAIGP